MASAFDIANLILAIIGLIGVAQLFYSHVWMQLPAQRLKLLDSLMRETTGLLRGGTEERVLTDLEYVRDTESSLVSFRARIEGLRAKVHAARGPVAQFKAWKRGLSRKIDDTYMEVYKIRAQVSTTSAQERRTQFNQRRTRRLSLISPAAREAMKSRGGNSRSGTLTYAAPSASQSTLVSSATATHAPSNPTDGVESVKVSGNNPSASTSCLTVRATRAHAEPADSAAASPATPPTTTAQARPLPSASITGVPQVHVPASSFNVKAISTVHSVPPTADLALGEENILSAFKGVGAVPQTLPVSAQPVKTSMLDPDVRNVARTTDDGSTIPAGSAKVDKQPVPA